MAGKYLLVTLGCKVNQYESQQVREVFASLGLRPARPGETADIAVVNTCAVTAGASRKTRQAIRRVARGGHTPTVVVGCGATADAARLWKLDGVVAVAGHDVDVCAGLRRLLIRRMRYEPTSSLCQAKRTSGATRKHPHASRDEVWMSPDACNREVQALTPRTARLLDDITPSGSVKAHKPLTAQVGSFVGHQRALLKVQDGCDAACSYCIIPRLRPQLRSKPIDLAVAEARDLVRAGHKEIIVTGIFLGAYGRETAVRKRWTSSPSPLAALIEALAGVEGLARLRLSSLEPGDVDASLLGTLSRCEVCVPHLHLPLQSGSPRILRRMGRQYTRDQFVAMINRVRGVLDRPAISTDIMVGFPGETEADFEATLDIARHAEFCKIHAFPFSPRETTAAAQWRGDFVHPRAVRRRMHRLADAERELSTSFRRRFIGEVERVIIEDRREPNDATSMWHCVRHGRADRYFEIHFDGGDAHTGDLASVRVDRITPTRTYGTYVSPRADSRTTPHSKRVSVSL